MPTIAELPAVATVGPADEVVISQAGTTSSVSVGSLLASSQPAIMAPTGVLLGRVSLGPGGPEPVNIGTGLALTGSTVGANGADHAGFAQQTALLTTDDAVLNSGGTPKLLPLSMLRGLFSAGTNVSISSSGVISATGEGNAASGNASSIAGLGLVDTLASTDLVAVSQGGTDHAITYSNLIDGETIDEFAPAAPAADTDMFPVGQGSSTMFAQTFGAVWTWIQGKLPLYRFPVIELIADTTLDGATHNGRLLVASQPNLTLTHSGTEGSGFSCTVINASSGPLTLDTGIITTSGAQVLNAGQIASLYCVTYSAGTFTLAWMSGASTAEVPGQVVGVVPGTITYTSIALAWSAPVTGGAATSYIVQYRVTNSGNAWTQQAASVANTTIYGLAAATQYDIEVIAANTYGFGPASAVLNGTTNAAPSSAPNPVTGLATNSATATTVTLSWSTPSGPAVAFYVAQYRITGSNGGFTAAASGITGTSYTVTGLVPSTEYDFEVYAVNSAGSSTPSGIATGATTIYAPGTPTGLTVGTPTQTTVPLSWIAPTSGGAVATYTVQYRVTGSGSWTMIAGLIGTSYTVPGLSAGTPYDFQVCAVNGGGFSAFTATTTATTVVAAPSSPSGLTAGLSTVSTQTLTWTAPSSGAPLASYTVQYSIHGANSWTLITGILGTSVTVTGLARNTSYDFEVAAVNAGGSSASTAATTVSTTNYKLSEGITPGANSSYAHGSGGHAFNVNINTASADGSCTAPASVYYAYNTSNTTPPTSGWALLGTDTPTYLYSPGVGQPGYGHTYLGNYISVPSTTGTYYIWYQALDADSNVQTQYCSVYTVAAT